MKPLYFFTPFYIIIALWSMLPVEASPEYPVGRHL